MIAVKQPLNNVAFSNLFCFSKKQTAIYVTFGLPMCLIQQLQWQFSNQAILGVNYTLIKLKKKLEITNNDCSFIIQNRTCVFKRLLLLQCLIL